MGTLRLVLGVSRGVVVLLVPVVVALVAADPAAASGGAPPSVNGSLTMSPVQVTVNCDRAGKVTSAAGVFSYDASRLTTPAAVDLHWYTYGDDGQPVEQRTATQNIKRRSADTVTSRLPITVVRPGLRVALSVDDHGDDGTWATTFRSLTCGRTGDVTLPSVTLGTLQCGGSLTVTLDATRPTVGGVPWQIASYTGDGYLRPLGSISQGQTKQATLTNVALDNAGGTLAVMFAASPADYSSDVRAFGGSYPIRPSRDLAAGRC